MKYTPNGEKYALGGKIREFKGVHNLLDPFSKLKSKDLRVYWGIQEIMAQKAHNNNQEEMKKKLPL